MRRIVLYPLLASLLLLATGLGYWRGWQDRRRAEYMALRGQLCFARYLDGKPARITWTYLGDPACREIAKRTGLKPPELMQWDGS